VKKLHFSLIILLVALNCTTAKGAKTDRDTDSTGRLESALINAARADIEKYRKSPASVTFTNSSKEAIKNAEIQITQVDHDFLFGCIIFDLVRKENPYKPELFKKRFAELFNFAVFPFYWASYEPRQGRGRWREPLEVIEWCRENNITTKGHPLVWTHPAGVPSWLASYDTQLTEQLLKARVMNIVGGFENDIDIWDVVNEPVNTRTWTNAKADDYTREPVDRIADYVEKACRWAHSANPEATLIVNDFSLITEQKFNNRQDRTRLDDFCKLVEILQSRDTPLHGLGIQAHEPRQHWFSPEAVKNTLDRLAKFDLGLHITEFIPQSAPKPITGGWRKGKWSPELQAEYAKQFYTLCFANPAVESINWWGFSDRNIWLDKGGLVDENYAPKPVYNTLKNLICYQWKTSLTAKTDNKGQISFRGFRGQYKARITTPDGKTRTFEFAVHKNKKNRHKFSLN